MCLNPRIIDNKNYGLRGKPGTAGYYKHTKLSKIAIPCGWCKECITNKQMGYIQRIMEESTKNEFFMVMLTYKESMIPKHQVNNQVFRYAEINDFISMCKRMDTWRERHSQKHEYIPYPFRYFGVTELGGKKHRPHFHVLIAIEKKYLPDKAACLNAEPVIYWAIRNNWCRNVAGGRKKAKYEPLFEYHEKFRNGIWERNYDCHYVDKEKSANGIQDCAWYVMKYMLKDCDQERRRQQALKLNLKPNEYETTWELIKTKRFYSTGWGLNPKIVNPFGDVEYDADIVAHIRKCIDQSKGNYKFPCWINEFTGQFFPLARYYKEKFLTVEDMQYFFDEDYETKYEIPEFNSARAKRERFELIKEQHELSAINLIQKI